MATCGPLLCPLRIETLLALLSKITHFEAWYLYLQRGEGRILVQRYVSKHGEPCQERVLGWTEKVLQLKMKAMLTLAKFELALDKIHH